MEWIMENDVFLVFKAFVESTVDIVVKLVKIKTTSVAFPQQIEILS